MSALFCSRVCKLLNSTLWIYPCKSMVEFYLFIYLFFAIHCFAVCIKEGLSVPHVIMQDDRKFQLTHSPRAETPNSRLLTKVRKENSSRPPT